MEKNNAVKITRDRRLTVIALIRSAALLGLLALAVFCVWHYRDDFNAALAKQYIAYLKSASYSGVTFERYHTDGALERTYAPLGVGMAVVESDFYNYVIGNDRVELSHQLKYAKPVIAAQDNWALIYDRGSTGYCIVTGYAVIRSGTASGSIITGAVSSGGYAIVSKAPGYRSEVTVYSKKHKELCRWDTPSEYIIMVSLSPKGDRMVCLSAYSDGTDMVLRLSSRLVETGELVFDIKLDCAAVYSIKHTKNADIAVLTDSGLKILNKNGEVKTAVSFDGLSQIGFSHNEQSDCLVVFKGQRGDSLIARVYDEKGKTVFEQNLSGTLQDCDCRGEAVAILLDSSLIWQDGDETKTTECIGARGVLSGVDGVPIVIYTDRIERIVEK